LLFLGASYAVMIKETGVYLDNFDEVVSDFNDNIFAGKLFRNWSHLQ